MHLTADFCLVPMGVEVSVSKYIAECQRVLEKSGLKYEASHVVSAQGSREVQEGSAAGKEYRRADQLSLLLHSCSCMAVSSAQFIQVKYSSDSGCIQIQTVPASRANTARS